MRGEKKNYDELKMLHVCVCVSVSVSVCVCLSLFMCEPLADWIQ